MASTFTVTISPSGGDYSTLQSAINALVSNLTTDVVMTHSGLHGTMADGATVTGQTSGATGTLIHVTSTQIAIKSVTGTFQNAEQIYSTLNTNYVNSITAPSSVSLVINISGTWSSPDTYSTAWALTGFTTGASNTITINGNNTSGAWNTSAYIFKCTDYHNSISINQSYVTLNNMQFWYVPATQPFNGSGVNTSSSYIGVTFTNCISKVSNTFTASTSACAYSIQTASYTNTVTFINCIALGSQTQEVYGFYVHDTIACYNCVAVGFTNSSGIGFYREGGTLTAENCYAGGNTKDYSAGITMTDCASDDTTGTSGLQSIAYSTTSGAYFTNVTLGSENLKINTGSGLIAKGVNLYSTFTYDIVGNTRQSSGAWDIGAFYYNSGGVTALLRNFMLMGAGV